jgi:hypothetical protein
MVGQKSFNDLKDSITFYEAYLPSSNTIKEEFQFYKRKWVSEAPDHRPNNAIDAYVRCNGTFFPNIKVLLQIYVTLPKAVHICDNTLFPNHSDVANSY